MCAGGGVGKKGRNEYSPRLRQSPVYTLDATGHSPAHPPLPFPLLPKHKQITALVFSQYTLPLCHVLTLTLPVVTVRLELGGIGDAPGHLETRGKLLALAENET